MQEAAHKALVLFRFPAVHFSFPHLAFPLAAGDPESPGLLTQEVNHTWHRLFSPNVVCFLSELKNFS